MKQSIEDRVGHPRYHCMRCQHIAMDLDLDPVPMWALATFTQGPHIVEVAGVRRQITHACPDGGVGIANIVGMETPEWVAQYKALREKSKEKQSSDPNLS